MIFSQLFINAVCQCVESVHCSVYFINSREAIAAIIGDIMVFLRLEEKYWRSPFLNQFFAVNFDAGNETREKIWSDFIAEQNEELSEKRVVFCLYRCFLESEKLRSEKKSVSERNFLVHVRHFKVGFFQFFCLRGLVMILFL